MKKKTLWIWGVLGTLLPISNSSARSKNLSTEDRSVTISVYNDAGIAQDTVLEAEVEAGRVFRRAGIEVKWLNCEATPGPQQSLACREVMFPAHLHLRIEQRALQAKERVLGISFLAADGTGCQADLFFEPMEELHNSSRVNLSLLLGHVAAHEVGHLLLGTNSHASAGIMQADWTGEDLASINLAGLYFSPGESKRMREKLSTGREADKQASTLRPVSIPPAPPVGISNFR